MKKREDMKNDVQTKKQTKLAVVLFVYLLAATNGFAQVDNFKDGYIITNQDDTIFGQIDLRTSIINQTQCRFRRDEKAQPVLYKPFDIKSYFYTGDGLYYISKTIEIDSIEIHTFIEFLVNGIMNLYYYEHKTDKYSYGGYYQFQGVVPYYFFEDGAGKMYAVDKKPDKILSDNYIQSDLSYRGMTTYILRDVPAISQDMKNMQFNQKSFIKIVNDYHNAVCTDGQQCIIYQNINPDKFGQVVQISPFIGYNFYHFIYIYDYYLSVMENYSARINLIANISFPTLGVEMKIVNPRWSKFFGLQAELSFSQLKIPKIASEIEVNNAHNEHYTVPIAIDASSAMYGKFKFGIIGIYPKDRIQPIAGCGFYTSKLFGENHNYYMDFGGSLTLGADYALNAKHNLIFRVNYDKVFLDASRRGFFADNINSVFSAKIGYSF